MKIVTPTPRVQKGTELDAFVPGHIYIRYSEYIQRQLNNPFLFIAVPTIGLLDMVTTRTFFPFESGQIDRPSWVDVTDQFQLFHKDA